MSNETPENDVIAEAEAIVSQSLAKLGTEECIEGDDCPIHFRIESEELDDEGQGGRIVSYIGNFAVVTADNPDLTRPSVLLRLIFGLYTEETVPATYETSVIHVGEGAIGDLYKQSEQVRKDATRYIHKHSDWAAFRDVHDSVLWDVAAGEIDLSTPIKEG